MSKLLIHLTCGPEDPTRAALGFLVGKAAVDDGHEVSLFLAADAVQLLREPVLDTLVGLGTGTLRESYDGLVAAGAGSTSPACRARPAASSPTESPRRRCRTASSSSRSSTTASSRTRRKRWPS